MTSSAISQAYWRKIKAGERRFKSVAPAKAAQVLELARADVANGAITAEEFCKLTGTKYKA